jgi:hypothetical protein
MPRWTATAEFHDGPIVPKISRFAWQDGVGEQSGGFDRAALLKKCDRAGPGPRALGTGTRSSLGVALNQAPGNLGEPAARNRARLLEFAPRQQMLKRPARPTGEQSDGPQCETQARNSNIVSVLHSAELGMVVAIEQRKRGVPMTTHHGKLGKGIRYVGLAGVCALLLGTGVLRTAASSPNPRRDVLIDFPADVAAPMASDRTLAADAQPELKMDESFTNQTKLVEYRFRLDSSRDEVHLKISAEVGHGLVHWDLIDPTGRLRARIGTTERASMNTTDIRAIKGEWLLRMTLQDATGRYQVDWTR